MFFEQGAADVAGAKVVTALLKDVAERVTAILAKKWTVSGSRVASRPTLLPRAVNARKLLKGTLNLFGPRPKSNSQSINASMKGDEGVTPHCSRYVKIYVHNTYIEHL